jgi:superfamily II DNA or RNA helicase
MAIIQIASNAVVAKIVNAPREIAYTVAEMLSYTVEGAEFMQMGNWNGKSSFYTHSTNTFPAGFVSLVQKQLSGMGHTVQVIRKPAPEPLGPEEPVVDKYPEDPRYSYQAHTMRQVVRHSRGIVQVATGGGKSRIAKLIVARFNRMTLFLTTRGVLMYQMKKDFERDMGLRVGVIGDGEWAPIRGMNVGMVQTLVSNLKAPDYNAEVETLIKSNVRASVKMTKPQIYEAAKIKFEEKEKVRNRTIKLLEMFEVVIGEEAHEAGGNSYYQILKHCKNAHIRVALTATPFMRSDAEDNMRLMAAFGEKLTIITEKSLIDRGILATPIFKFVECQSHPTLRKSSPWQRAYKFGIIEDPFRNAEIVKHAIKAVEHKLPVLILIQRKEHGAILRDLVRDAGAKVRFIQGSSSQDEREHALAQLQSGELEVLIGSTIIDVGVDVPAVGMVILAGGGKAEVAMRQRIGRGLRAKKSGPNYCFVVDFKDFTNLHLREHARTRRKIVEETEGFAENILPSGVDFPWKLFESAKIDA